MSDQSHARIVFLRAGLCAACLALIGGPLTHRLVAADAPKPADLPEVNRLPARATTYLYRMDWDVLRDRLRGTDVLAAIEDPNVQAFFAELYKRGQGQDAKARLYDFVASALHQELVLAGAPATVPSEDDKLQALREEEEREEAGEPDTGPGPYSYAAVAWDRGNDGDEFYAKFDAMVDTAGEWAGAATQANVGGMDFHVLGEGVSAVHTAWHEDRCYWAIGADAAGWIAQPAGDTHLGDSPRFQAGVTPLLNGRSSGPVALYYHDFGPGWERIMADPRLGAGWSAISWRSVDTMAGAAFVEANGYHIRHYWKLAPGRRTGLFAHSQTSRVDPEWLRRVPADASGFTTGVWDGHSFMLGMAGIYLKMFGAEEEMMAMAPMGLAPIAPLLKQIGPRYLIYRVPGRYGTFPIANVLPISNTVLVTDVNDAEAFLRAIDQLLMRAPGSGTMTLRAGEEIRVINAMMFSVCMAFRDNLMFITINPQLMKDALDNWDKPGPSIVDSAAYKQAAEKYLMKDACFEMYIAPRGFSRGIYDQYIPSLQQLLMYGRMMSGVMSKASPAGSAAGENFSALSFPRGSDIGGHTDQPTILSARDDGEGVLFHGHSPILCTPYYWAYYQALQHLSPQGHRTPLLFMMYLMGIAD
jgi:hypothetical protein